MAEMNYKLIYEVRKAKLNTNTQSNLRIQFTNEAIKKADMLHEQYLVFLRKHIEGEFEVTDEACMVDGIIGHVYAGSSMRGLGKRTCVFCGCDDFDDG